MVLGSQNSGQQSLIRDPVWHPDLQAMGYELPLPPPIPIIQATIASLKPAEIHAFIQESDTATIKSNGDDGESPLILSTLDLSQWTRVFEVANGKTPGLGLERLKELQSDLEDQITQDAEEYARSLKDAISVEVAIRAANNKEDLELADSQKSCGDMSAISHPFLEGMDIAPSERTAIEELQELIIGTQKQKEEAELIASGKRKWICEGAKQLAENPAAPLFKENAHLPGYKQVERLLKPASWSVANPDKSSMSPALKRQKLLTPPPSGGNNAARGRGNGGNARGYGRGRGQNYYNSPGQVWNSPNWQRFNKASNISGQNSNQNKRQSPWNKEQQRQPHTPDTVPAFSVMSICDSFGSETGQRNGALPPSGGQYSSGHTSAQTVSRIQLVSESPLKRKALSFANESEE